MTGRRIAGSEADAKLLKPSIHPAFNETTNLFDQTVQVCSVPFRSRSASQLRQHRVDVLDDKCISGALADDDLARKAFDLSPEGEDRVQDDVLREQTNLNDTVIAHPPSKPVLTQIIATCHASKKVAADPGLSS
jgi:hypothetical protein